MDCTDYFSSTDSPLQIQNNLHLVTSIIFFVRCCIHSAIILLRIFAPEFMSDIGQWFSLFVPCLFVLDNTSLIK